MERGFRTSSWPSAVSKKAIRSSRQMLKPSVNQVGLDAQQIHDIVRGALAEYGGHESPDSPDHYSDCREQVAFLSRPGNGCGKGGFSRPKGQSDGGGQRPSTYRRPNYTDDVNNPSAPKGRDQEVFEQLINLLKSHNQGLVAPVGYYFNNWDEPYTEEQQGHITHAGSLVAQVVGRSYTTPRTGCRYC